MLLQYPIFLPFSLYFVYIFLYDVLILFYLSSLFSVIHLEKLLLLLLLRTTHTVVTFRRWLLHTLTQILILLHISKMAINSLGFKLLLLFFIAYSKCFFEDLFLYLFCWCSLRSLLLLLLTQKLLGEVLESLNFAFELLILSLRLILFFHKAVNESVQIRDNFLVFLLLYEFLLIFIFKIFVKLIKVFRVAYQFSPLLHFLEQLFVIQSHTFDFLAQF